MIIFKPSQVHQGHYVYINGESTDIVVNLFAYKTITEYKKKVDEKIEQFKKK
jgi:predicted nucleotide-binding protein (sugar kinase/HSP70/actin superfamily)